MALDRTCKPKGKIFIMIILKEIPRGPLLEYVVLFQFELSQTHYNLDLEIKLMLPHKLDCE